VLDQDREGEGAGAFGGLSVVDDTTYDADGGAAIKELMTTKREAAMRDDRDRGSGRAAVEVEGAGVEGILGRSRGEGGDIDEGTFEKDRIE
jgi:hypothetical protein